MCLAALFNEEVFSPLELSFSATSQTLSDRKIIGHFLQNRGAPGTGAVLSEPGQRLSVVPTGVPPAGAGAAPHTALALGGSTHPKLLSEVWSMVKCDRQDPKPQEEKGETKWTITSRAVLLPDGNTGLLCSVFFFSETCVMAAWWDGFPNLQ